MLRNLLALGILSAAVLAQSQEPPPTTPPTQPANTNRQAGSAELNRFDWIVGEWTGDMNWTAPGMEGKVPLVTRISRVGQFYRFDHTSTMGDVTVTETSYLGFDPKTRKYVMYTFSSNSPVPRIERGEFTSDTVFVSTSDPWDMGTGTPRTTRSTMTRMPNGDVMLLIESNDNGRWTKIGDSTLKRKP